MHKILKYKWDDRNKHFFTSDLHTFHDPKWEVPIWKSRGYNSADECASEQIKIINDKVGETDILWNLGDNFLNTSDQQVLGWLNSIKCQNIMYLFGNHESQMYRLYRNEVANQYGVSDVEIYPLKMGNVTFLGNHQEIQIGKKQIVMNHFPLRIWHNDSRSSWCASGHSHMNDVGRRPEAEHQKALDIGFDYKNDVWSFTEIEDIMSTKSVIILDHNRSH